MHKQTQQTLDSLDQEERQLESAITTFEAEIARIFAEMGALERDCVQLHQATQEKLPAELQQAKTMVGQRLNHLLFIRCPFIVRPNGPIYTQYSF